MKVPQLPYQVKSFVFLLLVFLLSGCFEIREELAIKYDGSGKYMLKLDFSGQAGLLQKILKIEENRPEGSPAKEIVTFLNEAFRKGASDFSSIPGIQNSASIYNADSLIFGFQFDFESVSSLNQALALNHYSPNANVYLEPYYEYEKGKFRKDTTFYLRKLFKGFDSLRNNPPIDSVVNQATFHFILQAPGKIKRYEVEEDSIVQTERTALLFSLPLTKYQKSTELLSFYTKFKRR